MLAKHTACLCILHAESRDVGTKVPASELIRLAPDTLPLYIVFELAQEVCYGLTEEHHPRRILEHVQLTCSILKIINRSLVRYEVALLFP